MEETFDEVKIQDRLKAVRLLLKQSLSGGDSKILATLDYLVDEGFIDRYREGMQGKTYKFVDVVLPEDHSSHKATLHFHD